MTQLRRHALFRLGFVLMLGFVCSAPTPGDVGGCGQHPDPLDSDTFFELKRERDCEKCGECHFTTDYCTAVCSPDYSLPTLPEGCVPLVHDGEVCLDALAATGCGQYEKYTRDQDRLAPSECQFCPEVTP
ncbi:MAG TPA: hypothetical protein VMI54_21995 [Polyangiaceae bacterium]|nr:hypothetical protein [Polyangiaceae bacterium]